MGVGARRILFSLELILAASQLVSAQQKYFVGTVAGIATLSADAETAISSAATAISLYRPFNGPAVNAFAGIHFNDVVSVQGNYIYNANDITATAVRVSGGAEDLFEQLLKTSQHAWIADLLIYFRNQESRVRPYLSAGTGAVHFRNIATEVITAQGASAPLPERFSSTGTALRVAVGMDVALQRGWAFRYSFSETIRGNPVSSRLTPAGRRNLANFQNLFGVLKFF